MKLQLMTGTEAARHIDAMTALLIAYYAEWPYLQAMTIDEARARVAGILGDPDGFVVAAFHGPELVACNASRPLVNSHPGSSPFDRWIGANGHKREDFAYSALVLNKPGHRGKGVTGDMSRMLDAEIEGRGYKGRLIINIVRHLPDHRAPDGYRPGTGYFLHMGYEFAGRRLTRTRWTDIGDTRPTIKLFEHLVKMVSSRQGEMRSTQGHGPHSTDFQDDGYWP